MIYKIIAIVLLIVFYGCYFMKMYLQKRKGIQTDQIGKRKTGFVKMIEVTMKMATILVPMVEVLSIFWVPIKITMDWVRIIGAGFGILGTIFFICSVVTMKDNWRAGVPQTDETQLVTSGIYQISRNPAFLGFDLVYIGILCMFYNWILFAASIFAILMLHLQIINVEEEFLLATFGDEYVKYRKKVCRYLGRRIR